MYHLRTLFEIVYESFISFILKSNQINIKRQHFANVHEKALLIIIFKCCIYKYHYGNNNKQQLQSHLRENLFEN